MTLYDWYEIFHLVVQHRIWLWEPWLLAHVSESSFMFQASQRVQVSLGVLWEWGLQRPQINTEEDPSDVHSIVVCPPLCPFSKQADDNWAGAQAPAASARCNHYSNDVIEGLRQILRRHKYEDIILFIPIRSSQLFLRWLGGTLFTKKDRSANSNY